MAIKLVRTSERAYKELQQIAKTEDISLREAVDIVVQKRDELKQRVNHLEKDLIATRWDTNYIVKQMKKRKAITFPDMDLRLPTGSAFITKYLI